MVYVVFMAEHGRVQGSRQKRLWPSANFQNPFCTSEEPYFKLEFCFGNTNARLQALQLVHLSRIQRCQKYSKSGFDVSIPAVLGFVFLYKIPCPVQASIANPN